MTESSGEAIDGRWRIELLGGLRAERGDRVVAHFQTQKARALLAYLAYYPDRIHRRDELIALLWPEVVPEDGRNSLRQTLFLLRHHLEPPGVPAGSVLVADRTSVRLNREAVTTDAAQFGAACSAGLPPGGSADRKVGATPAASVGSSEEQAPWLARAVELYRGELLPGFFDDWILQERQWLAERFFAALRHLLAHLERASEFERALEYARHGVSADPLREEAHRDLIRLLAAVGEPAAALRQYQELERLLKEQLEATPEAATRALVREIERLAVLRQAPSAAARLPGTGAATPAGSLIGEGENRLVTLLFADMSRSLERTRHLDPEEAAARANRLLQAIVDVILKYEGRIDRFQGDGALAVFGVPNAHEDDPERAIRAALEIREAAHHLDLAVTAGINTGKVYVGAVGTERHQEMTVTGPAVGLAARLQEQAQPGQILVGEVTQRLTRQAFGFAPPFLGLKGLVQPVVVYAVEQALPRPGKARGIEGLRTELIGREEELGKLKAALAEVMQGRGKVVTLIGEAGVGKSRLVTELKAVGGWQLAVGSGEEGPLSLPTANCQLPTPLWLEGRCLELTMTAGYSLFVDLFRDYFAWRPEEDEFARGERLAACLRELVGQGGLAGERLEEMGPLLGHLLSVRFGNDWDLRLKNAGPEQIRHQTFLAVRDFLVALARKQPLVLGLEDLHWADSLSLDLISLLMETLSEKGERGGGGRTGYPERSEGSPTQGAAHSPLLLLCVYRPDREHKCWHLATIAARKCAGHYSELHLRELTPEQSRRLVESLLRIEDLPAAVKELILEKSRGNPFFVEEVVRSLIASGMVYQEGEVWRAREGIETISVPESIQSVILSRVDRLRPELKQVLQSASVIGRLFRRRLLEQTTPEGVELDRALWELEDQALIYQERVVPEAEYSFQHVLTQEAIYQCILRRRRAVLHQQVGGAIEALYPDGLEEYYEQLAYHYEWGTDTDKAVEYLLKAGGKASRAYLNEAAIDYLQRALERLEGSALAEARQEWRLAALSGLGQIYHAVGRQAEAAERLRQAIEVGQSIGLAPRERVRLYFWLAEALWWQCRYDEMICLGEEGLALLGEDTQSVEAALMNATVGEGHLHQGNEEKWREFTLRPVGSLEGLPYSEELRPVYLHIVDVYAHLEKNVEEAMTWLRALEKKAEAHQDLRALGEAHSYAATLLASEGDFRGAIARAQPAQELFTKIGDTKFENRALAGTVYGFLSLGEIQAAEECAYRVLRVAERQGEKREITRQLMMIGTTALCQGSWERAADAFRRAAQLSHELGTPAEADPTFALGLMHLARGEGWEALGKFRSAIVLARTTGFLALVLSGLESAMEDAREFRAFCHHFREEHPDVGDASFGQWFLEPGEPAPGFEAPAGDAFGAFISPDWVWHDPFGDCAFAVENGLQIHAANGRDLWGLNRSAPRLLRSVTGDFAVQTVCVAPSKEQPAIGGLLLWKDKANYLRLERGTRGEHEISFQGCIGKKDVIIGRGRLPSERLFLRLERLSSRVNALCSTDGQNWFTVGHVEFPVEDLLLPTGSWAGMHAIGNIDRTIYPGAYPEGTAIRFEAFQAWS